MIQSYYPSLHGYVLKSSVSQLELNPIMLQSAEQVYFLVSQFYADHSLVVVFRLEAPKVDIFIPFTFHIIFKTLKMMFCSKLALESIVSALGIFLNHKLKQFIIFYCAFRVLLDIFCHGEEFRQLKQNWLSLSFSRLQINIYLLFCRLQFVLFKTYRKFYPKLTHIINYTQ